MDLARNLSIYVISVPTSRISSFQQWAHFCHALQYGDQVLQWSCPPFPNEEGAAAAVEEYTGELALLCFSTLDYCFLFNKKTWLLF